MLYCLTDDYVYNAHVHALLANSQKGYGLKVNLYANLATA